MKRFCVNFREDDQADMILYSYLSSVGRKKRGQLIKALAGAAVKNYGQLFNPKCADALIEIIKTDGISGTAGTAATAPVMPVVPATEPAKKKSPRPAKKSTVDKSEPAVMEQDTSPDTEQPEEPLKEPSPVPADKPDYRLKGRNKKEAAPAATEQDNPSPNNSIDINESLGPLAPMWDPED